MSAALSWLGDFFLLVGSFLLVTGALGFLRFRDLYARIHESYWGWREISNQEILAQEAIQKEQIARGIGAGLLGFLPGLSRGRHGGDIPGGVRAT